MPPKKTLELPHIDVARSRQRSGVRWHDPPYWSSTDAKSKYTAPGDKKRAYRVSIRPKWGQDHSNVITGNLEASVISLPPLATSGNPDKSVSIRREVSSDLMVVNTLNPKSSFNTNPVKRSEESTRENTYPFRLGTKQTPLAPLENLPCTKMGDEESKMMDVQTVPGSTVDTPRPWPPGLLHGPPPEDSEFSPRYAHLPYKRYVPGAMLPGPIPKGQAPLRPEQVFVPSRRHLACTEGSDNDLEWENLHNSITLPRIEAVLRSEGIKPTSISEQIEKIRERCKRQHDYVVPPLPKPKSRQKVGDLLTPLRSSGEKATADIFANSASKLTSDFLGDIEQTRWLSYQSIEHGHFGRDFQPPRIVLLSSNVPGSIELLDKVVKKQDDILIICYDYEKATYASLIGEMKRRLNAFREGCRAQSLLLFCQGGPGYIYMLKGKVVTPQKIAKGDQSDLLWFWRETGEMMSRLRPEEACIHMMGCDPLSKKQGNQLYKEIMNLTKPNKVQLEALNDSLKQGRLKISLYLDLDKYDAWRGKELPGARAESDAEADAAILAVSSHNKPEPIKREEKTKKTNHPKDKKVVLKQLLPKTNIKEPDSNHIANDSKFI